MDAETGGSAGVFSEPVQEVDLRLRHALWVRAGVHPSVLPGRVGLLASSVPRQSGQVLQILGVWTTARGRTPEVANSERIVGPPSSPTT